MFSYPGRIFRFWGGLVFGGGGGGGDVGGGKSMDEFEILLALLLLPLLLLALLLLVLLILPLPGNLMYKFSSRFRHGASFFF